MDWRKEYRNTLLNISENTSDIDKLVKPHIPARLYKYGSFRNDYWRDTVFKGKIHLSPAKSFNDPFVCRPKFDYKKVVRSQKFIEKTILKNVSKEDLINLPKSEIEKGIVEGLREDIFVSFFSEIWNSLLMWAHYANNYNGYCLEYDTSKFREHILDNLYPVLYEKEYIDITNHITNMYDHTGLICNTIKAQEWSYEREWRIFRYNKEPSYFRRAINAIYLGQNCSKENEIAIVQWAKDNVKKVYMIKISKTMYELEADRKI